MPAPRLTVAVCTNRPPEAVAPTLEAVATQVARRDGAGALLVTSGLSEEEHERHRIAASATGIEALQGPLGTAAARNAAFEGLGDDTVIAYLDDDVLPADDWLERLAARWSDADRLVACIGGAIVPRWGSPPPSWVSERLWTSFALMDRGPGTARLNPLAGEDVWTANASFRVGPLRMVGGFEERLGPWGGVPLIGEEALAQKRLAGNDWQVLYCGDVRVEHVIGTQRLGLRWLARREYYRGVTAVLAGLRRPAQGPPRALKAAAGAVVAAARGDRPLAGERWARIAFNAGVAAAPLARRRLRRRGWPG